MPRVRQRKGYEISSIFGRVEAMSRLQILTLFLSCLIIQNEANENRRPIIGILTMQVYDEDIVEDWPEMKGKSFIYASYIKFIEGGGAQVVPILDRAPEKDINRLMNQINGLVLPGSLVSLNASTYAKQARKLYKMAIEKNKNGEYFPIWAICRGFQLLPLITTGGNPETLLFVTEDSHNASLPVKMTQEGKSSSRILKHMPKEILHDVETENLAAHFHEFSISPKKFQTKSKLKKTYMVVGTSRDSAGLESTAIFEDRKYPFYGLQFHPEKILYEWNPTIDVNHGKKAVRFAHYLSEFFIEECRKNHNKFTSIYEENRSLIYNFQPIFVGVNTTYGPPFTQMYPF